MANFFYYDANGQKFGPVNDAQLKALAAQGAIHPQTPMEADTGHKGTAGQIPGLFVAAQLPFAQMPQTVPMAGPTTIKTLNIFFHVFWISMVVGTPLCLMGAVAVTFGAIVESWGGMAAPLFLVGGVIVLMISGLVLVGATVFMFMLLYQLWKLIPAEIARTTPGKAVGFSFIPFFNLYWVFVAYKGLGEDMNKTLRQRGIQYQVNEGLGLAICILLPCGFVPYIGILFSLAGEIVMIFFFQSVKNGAIAMLRQRGY